MLFNVEIILHKLNFNSTPIFFSENTMNVLLYESLNLCYKEKKNCYARFLNTQIDEQIIFLFLLFHSQ